MRIYLNGTMFELQGGVTRTALPEWADNIRLDGLQKRKDRRYISSWAFDDWSNGLGLKRWNVDVASRQNGFSDVENCDTRNLQIVLSPAFNTCTVNPSRADLSLAFPYLSNLYFLETRRAGVASAPNVFAYQFTAPLTIGSFRALSTGTQGAAQGSLCAVHVIGGNICFIGVNEGVGNYVYKVATLGGLVGRIDFGNSGNIESPLSQMADIGGTLHMLRYFTNQARMYFSIADQGLASTSYVGSFDTDIGSYISPLISDGVKMYAQLPQGIYNFDATPAVEIDTSRAQELNGQMALFQNNLYFKNKNSLIKYDGTDILSMGYDLKDSLPSDKIGQITAMATSFKYLFAAVQGATYSHILTWDNVKWAYFARIPTAGLWVREMFLSDAPDSIDRLWCIFGNYGYPGYFLNPIVDPLNAGTYAYVPTGHFTPPIFDGGLPEQQGGFYHLAVSGRANGSNGIRCYYGLDTANPVTTLGDVASHSQAFVMGSPSGLTGHSIQPDFMLFSDSQGTSPQFYSSIINYLKKPTVREQYDFTIDLKKTSDLLKGRLPIDALVASLNNTRGLTTLVPFWYGYIGTKYVSIIDSPASEDTPDARIQEGERDGLVHIRCIEMTI